jgi:hypothetical protein
MASISGVHTHASGQQHSLDFERFLDQWKAERDAIYDVKTALVCRQEIINRRAGLPSTLSDTELAEKWAAIPPPLQQPPVPDTGVYRRALEKLLHPKNIPYIGWMSTPASVVITVTREIDAALTQKGWQPVLDQGITNSPKFAGTGEEMLRLYPRLKEAFAQVKQTHEAMQAAAATEKNGGGSDMEDVGAAAELVQRVTIVQAYLAEVDRLGCDFEKATGFFDRIGRGNAAALGLGLVQTAVSVAGPILLTPLVSPLLSMAVDFAEDPLRAADRDRTAAIINHLNMQYAGLSTNRQEAARQLRGLWKGPIEARLALLDAVLSDRIAQVPSSREKRLLREEQRCLRDGTLEDLHPAAYSVDLLLHPARLQRAAQLALVRKDFLRRLGANLGASALSVSLGTAGQQLVADDIAAEATSAGLGAGADIGTNLAVYATDERTALQPDDTKDDDEAVLADLTRFLKDWLAAAPATTTAAQALQEAAPDADSQHDAAASAEAASTSTATAMQAERPALLAQASQLFGGMWTVAQQLTDETVNAWSGLRYAFTYSRLRQLQTEAATYIARIDGGLA